ncbi:MAG: GNAT family N-acetyltransferase [Acidimicrobiia bacterium]|nr:GNAT family N-acetyltransferase [Acidimicrobiia bacterium]
MSEFELREIGEDDLDQYYDIRAQAFGRPESERESWSARVATDTDALRLGAYRQSDLVGGLRILPGGQWLEGRRVGLGGVAAVVVRPEARGQGVARQLLFSSLGWMRDHGLVTSALHPATTRSYRAAGWELAGDQATYDVPTRSLARLRVDEMQTVERLGPADRVAVHQCYGRCAPARHGFVDRSDSFWALRDSIEDEDGGFVYGVRTGEALAGYVRYQQQARSDSWGYHLRVDELVADDPHTAASLWRFLGTHSMQVESVQIPAPAVDQILLLLDEQDARPALINRWMYRILDLPRALAERGTSFAGSARLNIVVADPWPDAPAQAWTLIADAGTLTAEPAEPAGPPRRRGDLTTDIGALSAASIGRFSTRALAAAGRLGGTDDQIDVLGQIFAAPRADIADDF